MFTIDTTTYRKHLRAVGTGWDHRPKGLRPSSIIIHTTNGNRGSSFHGEASFLLNSNSVGAHYLVGKAGQIAETLPPAYRAWHAGVTTAEYLNSRSIGIECHHAVGEEWTGIQRTALTWLVLKLMADHAIGIGMIESHRAVALPAGRKIDPSDWTDRSFYDWRNTLDQPATPPGTFAVAPALADVYAQSGGLWRGRLFAPGYAITPLFTHVDGHQYQIFERTAARITVHGAVEWLMSSEVEDLTRSRL